MPIRIPEKKRKPMLTRHLDKGSMIGLTRAAIRKKNAGGHGKKTIGSHGKDWMHKDVRKVLEYMYDRKIFSNKLDTRVKTIKFMERAGLIDFGENSHRQMVDLVEDYIHQLFERHGIKPENVNAKKELIANFKTTMELMEQRHELLIKEIQSIGKGKIKSEKKRYDNTVARDAFAHIASFPMEMIVEDVLEATREVEKRIFSHK